jgi:hypothetical protein
MDKYAEELSGISKGQKTIAEALNQLEVVKEAFLRSSRIEQVIKSHSDDIYDIKNRIENFSTCTYVDSKTAEFKNFLEIMIENKFKELSFQLMTHLNQKINESDARRFLDQKVSWTDFIELKNTISSMQLKMNNHIDFEYPSYKAKTQKLITPIEESIPKSEYVAQVKKFDAKVLDFESKIKEVQEKCEKYEAQEKAKEIYRNKKKFQRIITDEINTPIDSDPIYEKIEDINNILDNISNDNIDSKSKFNFIDIALKSIFNEIKYLKKNCNKLENQDKELKKYFIDCLRGRDLQNDFKKDKTLVEKLPNSELEKLYKEIREKNKRVVIIENNLKHIKTEVEFLKHSFSLKLNEFKSSIETLEKSQTDQTEKFSSIKHNLSTLEGTLNESFLKFSEESSPRKLQIGNIDTENKKIKRNYENIKISTDEFSKSLTPVIFKRSSSKIKERGYNVSPRVPHKHIHFKNI